MSIFSKICSGNDIIDKCTYVFSKLFIEVDFLINEARSKYYLALFLYNDEGIVYKKNSNGFDYVFFLFFKF